MDQLAPIGPVYQAGTLSGNPLAMAAGLTMLNQVSEAGFYDKLDAMAKRLMAGFEAEAEKAGIALTTNQVGGMFGFFFSEEKNISRFAQVGNCNLERFKQFYHLMLEEKIYLAPSAYEAGFLSAAHTQADFDHTIDAAKHFFAQQ